VESALAAREETPQQPEVTPPTVLEGPAKQRVVATPVARRLAQEAGLDLSEIAGTGPGGRITKEDVHSALAAREAALEPEPVPEPKPEPAPLPVQVTAPALVTPFVGVRRTIAERMAHSAHSTAPVTLTTEVEATEMVRLRESLQGLLAEAQPVPTYNDILIKIVAQALTEHPALNSRLEEDEIHLLQEINIGLAVDTEQGLVVPVVRNADQMGLGGVAGTTRQLTERIRSRQFLPDDLKGGTFTITNLGPYEIEGFTPIINPPECAVLGVGQIAPKAVVRDGNLVARSMVTFSLTFDHRLVDGAPAARFLQRIKQLVENPLSLLI
jgi:pyruvate dehydrogenase E2 component (dihydrolipoamide acetyltransferase)